MHPVVSAHPETGLPAVFASPYTAARVLNMSESEADEILNAVYDLMDSQAVRWEYRWRSGDMIMWENRSGLMHSGRPDYPRSEARTFLRTTVRGAPIAEYAPPGGKAAFSGLIGRTLPMHPSTRRAGL